MSPWSSQTDKLYQPLDFKVYGGQITETRNGPREYILTIDPYGVTSDVVVDVLNPRKPAKHATFGGDFTAEIDAPRLQNGKPFLITWTLSKAVKDFNADEAITEGASGCAETFASAELNGGNTFAKVYTCTITPASPGTDVVLYMRPDSENVPVTEHGGQLTDDDGRTVVGGTFDLNGDDTMDIRDAKILYYTHTLSTELGDGRQEMGDENVRASVLGSLTDGSEDEALRKLLTGATARMQTELTADLNLDMNGDGRVDMKDIAVFYYSFALEGSLGNGGDATGIEAVKEAILRPLAANQEQNVDEMLRTAHQLRVLPE